MISFAMYIHQPDFIIVSVCKSHVWLKDNTFEIFGVPIRCIILFIYLFILFNGKRRHARAWNAIFKHQLQYENMMANAETIKMRKKK